MTAPFWAEGQNYRIWRSGLPAVGPGEKFVLVAMDDLGVYVRYMTDNEWGRDAGDFTLFIGWGSINAARQVPAETTATSNKPYEESHT